MKKLSIRLTIDEIASLLKYLESYWNAYETLPSELHHANMLVMCELYIMLYKRFSFVFHFLSCNLKRETSIRMDYPKIRLLYDELHLYCPNQELQYVFEKVTKSLVDGYGFNPNVQK